MTRLFWNAPSERRFETGLDRGALYPKAGGPGVPWNGLIAVDEEGAEGVTPYYADGRPTLYLPRPKEFQATLRAYTYPDEFAPMTGFAEPTDGLLLDSQMSEQFDLSYRTLVGDGLTGTSGAYKIHLVYNAVATPQAISHNTVSADVGVAEFSWTINAVPIRVDGYRATAHIVINSRSVPLSKLQQIEDILYGTPSSAPMIPSPSTLLSILSPPL